MASAVITREQFIARLADEDALGGEPVIVLEGGTPKHVWLAYEVYESLKVQSLDPAAGYKGADRGKRTLLDMFDNPAFDGEQAEFDIPRMELRLQPVEFD